MKIIHINNFEEKYIYEPISACIGNFDGIHLGHQALIKEVLKSTLPHAMITFNPHPIKYFIDQNYKELTPLDTKIELLENVLDYLIILDFNKELAHMSPLDFIKLLKKNMIFEIVCGTDYHFGYQAKGNADMLKDYFKTIIIPSIYKDNTLVKSQAIRNKIQNGDMKEANNLLGRSYTIKGVVCHGSHLGHTIGFPTANINDVEYLLPKNGVYMTITKIHNKFYKSMTNVGFNPTFNKKNNIVVETNILDFDQDIYGEEISVSFIELIRDEKKFLSIDELKQELVKNQEYVRSSSIKFN